MSGNVHVAPRESSDQRCALCHDAIGEDPVVCGGCGAVAHANCRESLGWCPTLGCGFGRGGSLATPLAVRVRERTGPQPPLWLGVLSLSLVSFVLFEVVLVKEMVEADLGHVRGAIPLHSGDFVLAGTAALHFFVVPAWIAARARGRAGAWLVLACQSLIAACVALMSPGSSGIDGLRLYLMLQAFEPLLVSWVVRFDADRSS